MGAVTRAPADGRAARALPPATIGRRTAMPMPHRTFAEVAKRRLVGKEGSERVATIRALLEELPGYRNGPYADLRKWLEGELDRTRVRGEGAAPRLAPGAPGGSGADRARRPAERGEVVAPAGALRHPDQDGRLRVHDAAARARADADRRRARPARRDPGSDRGRARGPRRRPRAPRRAPQRRRDRLVPGGRRPLAGARRRARRGGGRGDREARDPGADEGRRAGATAAAAARGRRARLGAGRREPRPAPRGDLGAHRA